MSLERDEVVRTALAVLDEVGLEGLTVRRIAAELGVKTPVLYGHFRNKQELLEQMTSAVFAAAVDDFDPAEQGVSWPDFARGYGRWLRRVILRHRDGAKMVGGTFVGGVLHAPTDFALRKFMAAGFSLRDATYAVSTIYCYVVGSVVEEQAAGPEAAEPVEGFDDRFEAGLKIIVRGLKPDLHYR